MKQENNKTSNDWGGAREGAGRKRNGTRAVTIRLSEEAIARLNLETNKSAFVNELILKA